MSPPVGQKASWIRVTVKKERSAGCRGELLVLQQWHSHIQRTQRSCSGLLLLLLKPSPQPTWAQKEEAVAWDQGPCRCGQRPRQHLGECKEMAAVLCDTPTPLFGDHGSQQAHAGEGTALHALSPEMRGRSSVWVPVLRW